MDEPQDGALAVAGGQFPQDVELQLLEDCLLLPPLQK